MTDLVPEEAIEAAALAQRSPSHKPGPPDADLLAIWKRTARITLEAAAPLILAAGMRQLAADLRVDLHRLPEYTHGSLAWRILNEIDSRSEVGRASVLRGERRPEVSGDLSRSLVDAAAKALAREGEVYAESIGLGPFEVSWERLSEDEREELRASARFAVAAVLETLAVHCDPVVIRPGSTEQALLSNSDLRGLAAEVKTGEDR